MDAIQQKAMAWLTQTFDAETQAEVQQILNNNPTDLADRFYKDLEFGTGGMRGTMGAGTNRINKYTLGRATQGLSNYLNKNVKKSEIKVAIAYDCRHNSKKFAKIVADVLSANNIKVFLFEDLRPTPVLSFTVRHLNCDAGIVLTASHNPPEYNGYKVYWADGGQIVPPHDSGIIDEVYAIDFSEINFKANENLIEMIGKNVDDVFIEESVKNASLSDKINRKDLKIVFTSIHGTSIVSVPDALKKAGYTDVHIVEEQRIPNGDFPTVKSPNPEEPEALKMATDLANKIGADIVIGTDPDCDRLGVAVRDAEGNMKLMNGNQTMVVMTNFLLKKWKEEGRINGKQFVGSTIVSTELVNEVAAKFGIETKVGLTGFKWIAKMVVDFPEMQFIGGGEESFGYMVGDFVRDKDAVTATLLACEVAAYAKQHGSSFYDELLNIYVENNFYKEHLISLTKKGMEGAAEIQKMLSDMRNNPLSMIDGEKVATLADYDKAILKDIRTGKETKIDLPTSNVLIYQTENGTRIAARPSGTEPKIKFYFSVNAPLDSKENAKTVEAALDAKIQRIIKEMNLI
ncbi:phospho-sugar mutase [Polaribacter sp. BAL334]|uniref:phospho-sugar mutase n=1 Tax=Polaribacter sp. BAL334 TaxID=1708178 RepID=UPI0018D26908|nr:phospho-sugar mutase [Polaribacter sp. BAL334]MBG7611168.1 phospho-sugar mutase [Polaribacter sp. BAL334]